MRKKPNNSRENLKLKKKTQSSRKKLNVSEDCPSPDLPSDVKKKPDLVVPLLRDRKCDITSSSSDCNLSWHNKSTKTFHMKHAIHRVQDSESIDLN